MKLLRILAAAGALAAVSTMTAMATDISGAGATFPYPIYAKWADAYKKATNVGLNYQSIGSGGGIKQIKAKTVTFGASDAPLPGKELDESGLIQFPMVMGGIVPVVNIDGIKSGDLVIDGPTLAKIFMGEIKTWNDPAIAKLNPSAKLPSQPIAVVHRSDGSGTTYNFAYYLAEVSPDWKSKVGFNTSVEWPVGIGAKGNDGIAGLMAWTKGAIGYVEHAYAVRGNLAYVSLKNRDGAFVLPSRESFQSAVANADWSGALASYASLADRPGSQTWPITGATYVLIHKQQQKQPTAIQMLKFFDWTFHAGAKLADELEYVPMPKDVVPLIQSAWEQVKDPRGQPAWPGAVTTTGD